MASSHLITHCGARQLSRIELDTIEAPPATATWYPLKHSVVVDTVATALMQGGFHTQDVKYAVSRNGARLFATMDLASTLRTGVNLCVGIRNSTDKSLPLGFCAGNRVMVCDNLCFRSELLVQRKHTRFGQERFAEAICQSVQSLQQFRAAEAARIQRFQQIELSDTTAESLMLRGYEQQIVSHRLLPRVIREWRQPSYEAFRPRTLWSLLNAFTTALGERQRSNPQQFAALTIRLQELLGKEMGIDSQTPLAVAA
jgi:hypothetical protein